MIKLLRVTSFFVDCRLPIPKISKSAICVNFRGSSEKKEIEDFCFSGTVDFLINPLPVLLQTF